MSSSGIGTFKESHLHASLKQRYAEPGDDLEVKVGQFIIDIVRGDRLIEIQTQGFSALRNKLDALLDEHPILIVHPLAGRKWIVRGPHDGRPSSRRKSPKSASIYELFAELVSFPWLVDHPNLSIEFVITDQEEIRHFDGNKSWRRKGWTVVDRRLIDITEIYRVGSPADLERLIPTSLAEPFTTGALANEIGRPRRIAQQMAYCLRECGVVEIAGKQGNAMQYQRAGSV